MFLTLARGSAGAGGLLCALTCAYMYMYEA